MNINNFTSKVGQYIQSADDKKCIVQSHFDWNAIKRTPQIIKQKTNVGSHTTDFEFDQMKEKLNILEKRVLSLVNCVSLFSESHISLLDDNKLIGLFIKELFDPYNSLPKSTLDKLGSRLNKNSNADISFFLNTSKQLIFEEEYNLWEHMEIYLKYISQTEPAIRKELERLTETISLKINELLPLFKNINKKIKDRNFKLLDYDKLVNSHNSLLIKQKTKELSIQEAKRVYNLERKLDDVKHDYDESNNLLKRELPILFNLMESMFQPIQIIVYYIQLTVYYQIYLNLIPISKVFQIDFHELTNKKFKDNLMENCILNNSQATDLINELMLFKSSKDSSTKCLTNQINLCSNPIVKHCKALYNFTALEPNDISIKKGDIIEVIEQEGNWWKGKLGDEIGTFPANYVELL